MRRPPWLYGLRDGLSSTFDNYRAWIEREWAELKARRTPPPLMLVLASLPALVGLRLLDELEAEDALLLTRLEQELAAGHFGFTAEEIAARRTEGQARSQEVVRDFRYCASPGA